ARKLHDVSCVIRSPRRRWRAARDAREGGLSMWGGVGSETRTPRTIAGFGRIALEALSRATSHIVSSRMIRCKRACSSFRQLIFLLDPLDSFHTAVHMRMRDSAYCGRSNQSERLHAGQSSQSYSDQLTGRLSDCASTLQGLQVQNCNRSEA